ncbi:substrate-binding domain-containing protein [Kitasatospora camelliae]|uniref:Substrate-binding domain-containing protein n=1 Tax=Kitasatospora camelliae TaxID=3156397 RepID=A0AAU8K4P1_9ACTN
MRTAGGTAAAAAPGSPESPPVDTAIATTSRRPDRDAFHPACAGRGGNAEATEHRPQAPSGPGPGRRPRGKRCHHPATAAAQVQAVLAAHPDLRGVFAGDTITARGINTGLKLAGKQRVVKVVGFDAGPEQVAALGADTLQVLVAQDPAGIGTQAVYQLAAAFEGRPVTKEVTTTMAALTQEDIDNPRLAKYFYRTSC